MICVAVKVQMKCGTCRGRMPVNMLSSELICSGCGRPTALDVEAWHALLREPLCDGPKMIQKETRWSSAGKLSADYTRTGPCCQVCKKKISAASIRDVRGQAMLRCERCSKQTWVRAVPSQFAGALPNISHLVGEEPVPLTVAPATESEAAAYPCPRCGSPVPVEGLNRAGICHLCNASVHVPDQVVLRSRREATEGWLLCFDRSIADEAPAANAVAAGLFDWDEPPAAAVDAEGNLYCAATQLHWVPLDRIGAKQKRDNVLWSIDPSMNIRWLQRGRSKVVHLALSPKGALLATGRGGSPRPWLFSSTGFPMEQTDLMLVRVDGALLDGGDLTCDPDGSLLIVKGDVLRRVSRSEAEVPASPGDGAQGAIRAERLPGLRRVCCGPDGSIYHVYSKEIVRVEPSGREKYRVNISSGAPDFRYRTIGADLRGNAYVLRRGELLRIDASGEQRIILRTARDRLPRDEMSIAVCPDGSFWLFGKDGAAWKFDASGVQVFASEKESRPEKPTSKDVRDRQMAAFSAKFMAEYKEQSRPARKRRAAAKRKERILLLIFVVGLVITYGVVMVILFWFL